MHTFSNDQWYVITFITACGCSRAERHPEYVVRDMEFLNRPIVRPRPAQPGEDPHLGKSHWRFRTFKCTNVDTTNRTAVYEEYLP